MATVAAVVPTALNVASLVVAIYNTNLDVEAKSRNVRKVEREEDSDYRKVLTFLRNVVQAEPRLSLERVSAEERAITCGAPSFFLFDPGDKTRGVEIVPDDAKKGFHVYRMTLGSGIWASLEVGLVPAVTLWSTLKAYHWPQ